MLFHVLAAACLVMVVGRRFGAQVKRLAELQAYMSSDQDAAAHRAGPSLRSPADFTQALAAAKAAAAATTAATPSADRSSAGGALYLAVMLRRVASAAPL